MKVPSSSCLPPPPPQYGYDVDVVADEVINVLAKHKTTIALLDIVIEQVRINLRRQPIAPVPVKKAQVVE